MDKDVPGVRGGAGGEAHTPCPVGFLLCHLMKKRKQSAPSLHPASPFELISGGDRGLLSQRSPGNLPLLFWVGGWGSLIPLGISRKGSGTGSGIKRVGGFQRMQQGIRGAGSNAEEAQV